MRNQTISSLSTEYNATLYVLLIIALTCELVHANSVASFATFYVFYYKYFVVAGYFDCSHRVCSSTTIHH